MGAAPDDRAQPIVSPRNSSRTARSRTQNADGRASSEASVRQKRLWYGNGWRYDLSFRLHKAHRWLTEEKELPSAPCSSALRTFAEHPASVLASTSFLLVARCTHSCACPFTRSAFHLHPNKHADQISIVQAYLCILSFTGPRPDDGTPDEQRLLLGMSAAGLVVWGMELHIKLVSYGLVSFFLDGFRCVQFLSYLSLLVDVFWQPGVAFVYLRALEVMHNFDVCLQAVQETKASSWGLFNLAVRLANSARRLMRTIFVTLSALLPVTCMLMVFVVLQVGQM